MTIETPRLSFTTNAENYRTPLKDSTLNYVTEKQNWKLQPQLQNTPKATVPEVLVRPNQLTAKENNLLASKGVKPMSRGKSRQKIKVFSMF